MHVDAARELLERVKTSLDTLAFDGNLLSGIGWPRDVEERFFANGAAVLPDPTYEVDRDGFNRENADLARIFRDIEGDEPIPTWLRAVVQGAIDRNRLLLARGTREFGRLSREKSTGARARSSSGSPPRTRGSRTTSSRASASTAGTRRGTARTRVLSAEALRDELARRSGKHRPHLDLEVLVDDRCASKAIAGATRVRVRAGRDVRALGGRRPLLPRGRDARLLRAERRGAAQRPLPPRRGARARPPRRRGWRSSASSTTTRSPSRASSASPCA